MIFDREDYDNLATLFHPADGYAGYRPNVAEIPNGDGKVDAQKRFLHIALKYNPPKWAVWCLARAHFEACKVAEALGVDPAFYPRVADGTLRVLEYPVGVGGNEHTDFDLFTILCWRETPADLELTTGNMSPNWKPDGSEGLDAARAIDPYLHIGELGELVGLGPATPHRVIARPYIQRSIVYFAMPDHNATLWGTGSDPIRHGTVGEWLRERVARSRLHVSPP